MNFFELTGEQLSRIYTSLERVGEKEVRERLDGVGVGASMSLLREFYREHPRIHSPSITQPSQRGWLPRSGPQFEKRRTSNWR